MSLKRSDNYDNLLIDVDRDCFYFKKYSAVKGKTFQRNTDIYGKKNEAKAYKEGVRLFNEWLGEDEINIPGANKFRYQAEHFMRDRQTDRESRSIREDTFTSSINSTMFLLNMPSLASATVDQITSEKWDEIWKLKHAETFKKYRDELATGKMNEDDVRDKLFRFSNARKALVQILTRAQKAGLIKDIPDFKNPDPPSRKRVYRSPEQVKRIIDQFYRGNGRVHAMMVYILGQRPGEACKMELTQFEHLHDGSAILHVRADQTKTKRARDIYVPPNLMIEIKKRMARIQGNRHNRIKAGSIYLFPMHDDPNRPMDNYRSSWDKACVKAGDKGLNIYSLRHSMLTDRADAGVPSLALAKYTDTSVRLIEKVYYKINEKAFKAIAEQGERTLAVMLSNQSAETENSTNEYKI